MTSARTPRALEVFVLILGLLVAHLPLNPAAVAKPGVLVSATDAGLASESVDTCCEPTPVLVSAVDLCCEPTTVLVAAAQDACCAPSRVESEEEGEDPCCPNGCSHCPQPCCSTPLAMIAPSAALALDLVPAPQAAPRLEEPLAADVKNVFHPPRS